MNAAAHVSTPQAPAWCVALVGNPNCGKTALFNLLTGARQKVANYAGVTVERKVGLTRLKKKFIIAPLSNGNISLMTAELMETLVDHSAGNYRLLMIMGGELLAHGMAHDVAQLDEKCYLDVYQPRNTRPALKKKAKV